MGHNVGKNRTKGILLATLAGSSCNSVVGWYMEKQRSEAFRLTQY